MSGTEGVNVSLLFVSGGLLEIARRNLRCLKDLKLLKFDVLQPLGVNGGHQS